MVDFQSSVPIYIQIRNEIKNQILSGELKIGEKIASEAELMEGYGVSRVTLRNAIAELAKEGLLIKKQGKGTFVNKNKLNNKLEHLKSFSETCQSQGLAPSSITIDLKVMVPRKKQTSALRLDQGDQVIFLRRLRLADGEPVMYEDDYFSFKKFSFLLEESLEGSLFEVLKKRGIVPLADTKDKEIPHSSLEVITAPKEQIDLLACNAGAPVFYLETIVLDENKAPIHMGQQYMRGDRFKFLMK